MRVFAIAALLLIAPELQATDPPPAADPPCAAGRLIVGARTRDRPIPLMSGDAASGFRPACSVPWAKLSPRNEPLAVAACFQDNLLQIDNETACGSGKGKLWIPARWVVTAGPPVPAQEPGVACQRLETGVYAGTRGLDARCVPKK
jgi:hypothetical protein